MAQDTIDHIQTQLREGSLSSNPHQVAEYVGIICGELAYYLAMQSEIEIKRAKEWLDIRKDYKSDAQATRAWELTPQGIEWQWYEARIKRIKAVLTGLKTLLKMAEMEAHNLT